MATMKPNQNKLWPIVFGLLIGLIGMGVTVSLAWAAPLPQTTQPQDLSQVTPDPQWCGECHLDVANSWSQSAHAHAFDDPFFQERWHGLGDPGDCLLCHTTNYQATTGSFTTEGVSCEACHGQVDTSHPPAPVPVRADSEACGACHTTTLGEWRLTGHATSGVGCISCHDPHSQQALFENPDELCINCHTDTMSEYLEDIHSQNDIGCVDCHALVIPPEEPPVDGIVPTGHTFTITPATCVACHTDALHAGFSLPGFEGGASNAIHATGGDDDDSQSTTSGEQTSGTSVQTPAERIQSLENDLQTTQAALANRNMLVLFQGAVVGLVLGGSTAWIVASNIRRGRQPEIEEEEKHE